MKNHPMLLETGLAALALVLVVGTAQAQDPVKLSPQYYKVLLENEHVRVLEVNMKAGDKEPMHSHPAMVVYLFTGSKVKATMPDGKSVEREGKAGTAIWSEPVSHAFEVLGPGENHVLLIELKGMAAAKKEPAKKAPVKKS